MATLSLSLLGPFQGKVGERPLIKFRSNKVKALLIYLVVENALSPQVSHQREALMELLWPGMPLKSAQANLRQTIYLLHQIIPEIPAQNAGQPKYFLLSDRQSVQINPNADIELDVASFQRLLDGPFSGWSRAVSLYRGNFLADFFLPDSELFEEWAANQRALRQQQALTALDSLTNFHLEKHDYYQAQDYAQKQLEIDELRESAHRQLMIALARSGDRNAALIHYKHYNQILADELGVAPTVEITDLFQQIQADTFETHFPKPVFPQQENVPQECIPHNLPSQPTPFIGREDELAALDDLISDPDVRLITIVGPGGIGKTRLALAWAEQYINGQQTTPKTVFTNGVFFVSLAPLSEVDHIIPVLAEAFNFPLHEGEQDKRTTRQQILDFLHEKQILLVLDNFEHLMGAVDLVSDILETAPNVFVIITSRQKIQLRQEQVYPIYGLEFPDWELPADALEYTAVRLFLQAAHRSVPNFDLQEVDDLSYLARICRLVEGMPLAIELAAAWVDTLSLAEIATEIQQGIDFLETEMRDVPERHHSIRATIETSWQKLNVEEKLVFSQLSIFRGGFTLEAAKVMTEATLQQMSRLVSKSFLQFNQRQKRYQVHELIRQFGVEKLSEDEEMESTMRNRHCSYYMNFLHHQEQRLKGRELIQALKDIERDLENIRKAWFEAISQFNINAIDEGLGSLYDYYHIRGLFREGEQMFRMTVDKITKNVSSRNEIVLAKLKLRLSLFCRFLFKNEKARDLCEESLIIFRRSKIQSEMALALEQKGYLAFLSGAKEREQIKLIYEESLAVRMEINEMCGIVDSYFRLAQLAYLNREFNKAKNFYQNCIKISKEIENPYSTAVSLKGLGEVLIEVGNIQGARHLCLESLSLLEKINAYSRMLEVYSSLGRISHYQEDYYETEKYLQKSLLIVHTSGNWKQAANVQRRFAFFISQLGKYEEAKNLIEKTFIICGANNDEYQTAITLDVSGLIDWYQGNHTKAKEQLQKALTIYRGLSEKLSIANGLNNLGHPTASLGQYAEAASYFLEALQISQEAGYEIFSLEAITGLAYITGKIGGIITAIERLNMVICLSKYEIYIREISKRYLSEFEDTLSSESFSAAKERGKKLDLAQVISELLDTTPNQFIVSSQLEDLAHESQTRFVQ